MKTELLDCGHPVSEHSAFTTGYGEDSDGKKMCYACCANEDKRIMDAEGRYTLYLVKRGSDHFVTNWPGSLEYKAYSVGYTRHNWGGHRVDFRFTDHKGKTWWGYKIGRWTQIVHVKRMK